MELRTEIRINAPCEKVWKVLTGIGDYPSWNPFITSLTGELKVGGTLHVQIEPPGSKPMKFSPKVLSVVPNKELIWIGRVLLPGVFDGKHKFVLVDNGNGTTTFQHSEDFKGILVPFMKKMLTVNTRNGFELMNAKLKERCERP